MVMEGEQGGVRPRNGVQCTVDWARKSVSERDKEVHGDDVEDVSVDVFVAPEVRSPSGMPNEALQWTRSAELHLFWFVKRAQPWETSNMELVYVKMDQIIASDC